jgi:hypothetical protein|tara:strand:+ start:955 stop:1083 length:129 start_codon:yes stop_codon:yes gene_type:complete
MSKEITRKEILKESLNKLGRLKKDDSLKVTVKKNKSDEKKSK